MRKGATDNGQRNCAAAKCRLKPIVGAMRQTCEMAPRAALPTKIQNAFAVRDVLQQELAKSHASASRSRAAVSLEDYCRYFACCGIHVSRSALRRPRQNQ